MGVDLVSQLPIPLRLTFGSLYFFSFQGTTWGRQSARLPREDDLNRKPPLLMAVRVKARPNASRGFGSGRK